MQVAESDPDTVSFALAEYVTAFPALESASTVMFAGRERAGDVVSRTVTVNDAGVGVELPAPSVAVHETVVVPSGKVVPDSCPPQLITGAAPLSSVAVIE